MKNRKILSTILAIALFFSMAVVAFAATVETEGELDGCYYATHSTCELYHYSSIIEFLRTSDPYGDYLDYLLRSDVRFFNASGEAMGTIYGTSTARISSNYSEFEFRLGSISAFFYVNGTYDSDVSVLAG